ncbi:MAG: hypothetical protein J6S14_19910 [Clostridia bacterium]|nr:hypothetical protein [Clostridia bacterium]
MYLMDIDKYECDFCGFEADWDGSDPICGSLWECEECGKHFCEKCFTDRWGRKAWDTMLHAGLIGSFETSRIMCPECYGEILRDYPEKEK